MDRLVTSLAVALCLTTGACTTLSTLRGAKTLEKGQFEVAAAPSVQSGGSPVQILGLPLPQLEGMVRLGIAEDVDVGLRVFFLGVGFDVRYRFYQDGRLHLAVDPGFGVSWVPFLSTNTLAGDGSLEVRMPVLAEVELTKWLSVSGGPQVILRDRWTSAADQTGKGVVGRLDVFAGGGTRIEAHPKWLVVGASGDLYAQPARRVGPAWAVTLDLGIRTPAR